MRIALALILVAACGSNDGGGDDVAGGGDCDAQHSCASGVCSITHDDTGKGECLDAAGDIDGDGLTNDMDYCNSSEGGQYDEDRDLIGDDCDKCPIAAPLSTLDRDGDAVESPCDPDPTVPGDKIVVFNGFRGGIPTAYRKAGSWTTDSGGDAIVMPDSSSATATLTTALPLSATNMAVLVQYRIDSVDAAAARSYVGLIARDARPASSSQTKCGGQRSGGSDSLAIETEVTAMSSTIPDAFDTASQYQVALRVEGLSSGCAMIADSAQLATQASSLGEPLSEAGLFVQGAKARFQYLLVIQRDTSSSLD